MFKDRAASCFRVTCKKIEKNEKEIIAVLDNHENCIRDFCVRKKVKLSTKINSCILNEALKIEIINDIDQLSLQSRRRRN
jgi:hypothetical protein